MNKRYVEYGNNQSVSPQKRNTIPMKDVQDARRFFKKEPAYSKMRECLSCDKKFLSSGPQNRLCYGCGTKEDSVPIYSVGTI